MPAEQRLLLVGCGHSHLHLVKNVGRLVEAGYDVTLVGPADFDYSGAASGIAIGVRPRAEGHIDVAALTHERLTHVHDRVAAIDLAARTVRTDSGATLGWDVVSFNIGSVARVPHGIPIDETVVPVKPLSSLITLHDRLDRVPIGRGHRVTVIGAGPSGVELAGHLAVHPHVDAVTLLDEGPVLAGLPDRAVRRVTTLLTERGVALRCARLRAVGPDAVILSDGARISHDLAVLATGLAPPLLASTGELGGHDGIPVRATLQHRDRDDVYATGDCADFLPGSLARIGVHGVRQAPVLLTALEARRRGGTAPTYRPPAQVLSILDLGGGTALAVRGRWWWLGRTSLWLKRRIDRKWIDTYRA